MTVIEPFLAWLEAASPVRAISQSAWLIPYLSAAHLLGFTLVAGSALVANLRVLGVLLPTHAVIDVTEAASRRIQLGLAVSIVTGTLLFSWRATTVAANDIFQLKMFLLVAAVVFHYSLLRTVIRRTAGNRPRLLKVAGAVGLLLWIGLALAGCAFILIE